MLIISISNKTFQQEAKLGSTGRTDWRTAGRTTTTTTTTDGRTGRKDGTGPDLQLTLKVGTL